MTPSRPLLIAVTTTLALAACGGGDDSTSATTTTPSTSAPSTTTAPTTTAPTTVPSSTAPPTTIPPTTAPPTTVPATTEPPPDEIQLTDTVTAENGFLTIGVASGWTIDGFAADPVRIYEDGEGLPWELSMENIVDLAQFTSADGHAQMVVVREGRYLTAPEVLEWDDALAAALGIQPNIDVTVEWGGGRGEATRGKAGARWVRHESVQVGPHLVSVVAISDVAPTDRVDAEVSAMIQSITIDPAALSPLAHAYDTTVSISAEATGSTPFSISILVPPTWVMPGEDLAWASPAPANADDPEFIEYITYIDDSPLEVVMDDQLDEWGEGFFERSPVVEVLDDVDGAEVAVAWDGPIDQADAALVVVTDGVVAERILIRVPGQPRTVQDMIDSILINESALLT